MATVLLTATPATPPTYNPSMADTFSWVPVEGAGRPLFARAVYNVESGISSAQATTIIALLSTIADNTAP